MDHHLPHYSVSSMSLFNNPKKKPKLKLTSPFHFQDQTNIARPCTECGKKFSSWKALFGHMRCHPERQWRGINPPPNFLRPNNNNFTIVNPDHSNSNHDRDDDDEVASCLLMLANGPPLTPNPENNNLSFDFDSDIDCRSPTTSLTTTVHHVPPLGLGLNLGLGTAPHYCSHHVDSAGRFKCSGCRKVFGSHQALGGHRASHKNVKGCFAITKKSTSSSSELVQDNAAVTGGDHHCNFGDHNSCNNTNSNNVNNVHKCSICLRVFSSGQALGGHMRCHWEKKADYEQDQSLNTRPFDLNLPAPIHDDSDHTVHACGDDSLDLTLGV